MVGGGAGRRRPTLGPALAALRRLVEAGGARPRPAAGVVAELTGTSANALYRALTKRNKQARSCRRPLPRDAAGLPALDRAGM